MMEEKKNRNPIGVLASALAVMTERAYDAERQRDAAREDASNWYDLYQRKDAQVKDLEAKLAAEIAEHKKTRNALQRVMGPDKKGES